MPISSDAPPSLPAAAGHTLAAAQIDTEAALLISDVLLEVILGEAGARRRLTRLMADRAAELGCEADPTARAAFRLVMARLTERGPLTRDEISFIAPAGSPIYLDC